MATLTKSWKQERIERIEKYLAEVPRQDFINDAYIEWLISRDQGCDRGYVNELISKAVALQGLKPEEAAYLLNIKDKGVWEGLFSAAAKVKQEVYGNRIVLFAPLYLSSACVNDCLYCGFRESNTGMQRSRLSLEQVKAEAAALAAKGHKRLLTVYGEGRDSDADYIAGTVRAIYGVKNGPDEIRRVNINAAPLFREEYGIVKDAAIGTYQVFQETYHKATYAKMHPPGTIKNNYYWRLYALHRAQEAGITDVAIGALFGLYDWRFEVLSLIYHTRDMEKEFGVGSHTISFPRLEPALNTGFSTNSPYRVSDEDFKKIIAVLRLSVPYTGMILTARERPELRRELIKLGISQTDAGSNISIGGYSANKSCSDNRQFELSDNRTLDEFMGELVADGYIPSFCTADYRCGRVGCEFMGLAKAGKIKKLCLPNAVLTFKEYLLDYASPEVMEKGGQLLNKYVEDVKRDFTPGFAAKVENYLAQTENGKRDLFF